MLALNTSPITRAGFLLARESGLYSVPDGRELHGGDVFTALYEPRPEWNPDCNDSAWCKVMEQTLDSASYHELHSIAMLEHEVAAVAAEKLLPDLLAAYERQRDLDKRYEAGEVDDQQIQREQARISLHIRAVVAQAQKEAQDAKELLAIAPQAGTERAQFLRLSLSAPPVAREAAVRLAKWYGRLREEYLALQAQEVQRVALPVGVTFGDDLLRMVPAEYCILADPELELVWLQRFVDKALQVYDRQMLARPKRAGGDAILLVDESSSMDGEKVQIAKAFALLSKQVVEADGRKCHLASFGTSVHPATDLAAWATQQIGGGTSFCSVLAYAMDELEKTQYDHADVVMVTDGEDRLAPSFIEAVKRHKQQHGWRLFVVFVEHAPDSLREIADAEVLLAGSTIQILQEGGEKGGLGY